LFFTGIFMEPHWPTDLANGLVDAAAQRRPKWQVALDEIAELVWQCEFSGRYRQQIG
jgi:hypothetical protein